jgi:predicted nuclease of predicted toxin-antitoxin system
MQFLADENIEKPVVDWLRGMGHDVLWAVEACPGAPDDRILRLAQAQTRVIITNDKGFGATVYRLRKPIPGLILIRASRDKAVEKIDLLKQVFAETGDAIDGRYIIVNASGIRIRRFVS